jgi:uncharacterized protein YkwD
MVRILLVLGVLLAGSALRLAPHSAETALALTSCSTARAPESDSEEQSMLSLINAYRIQSGFSALAASASLGRAALWKSADMAQNQYFAHDDLSRAWSQRILDCGYTSTNAGEDLAAGNADAQHTFEQWRTSPPHNANLLGASFHVIGIGRAQVAAGQWYWTADFGAVADTDTSAPTFSTSSPASTSARSTIGIGHAAIVNTPNECLRAHASPSESSYVAACLPDGTPVLIVSGPIAADGYTWWSASGAGWVAGQYLKPGS